MVREIRAKFSKGKIEPLEELELEEGEEVVLAFQEWPAWKRRIEANAHAAGICSEQQVIEIIREARGQYN